MTGLHQLSLVDFFGMVHVIPEAYCGRIIRETPDGGTGMLMMAERNSLRPFAALVCERRGNHYFFAIAKEPVSLESDDDKNPELFMTLEEFSEHYMEIMEVPDIAELWNAGGMPHNRFFGPFNADDGAQLARGLFFLNYEIEMRCLGAKHMGRAFRLSPEGPP